MNNYYYGPIIHTVGPNETLYRIAQQYGTTVQAIVAANPGISMGMIYPGQRLYIWPAANPVEADANPISRAVFNLSNQIRLLWEQHITWTRLTTVSMVFDLPNVTLVTNRLLKNPDDFAALLAPIYGNANASRFSDLLRGHLIIAAELITAAKAGDAEAAADIERRWYNNAREIAVFLSTINPYWSQAEWERMLFDHLALVKAQAVDMINKNYQAEIDRYAQMERQAMMMADVMTNGIVRQFPNNFR